MRILLFYLIIAPFICLNALRADDSGSPLLKKLFEKGILTKEEVRQIEKANSSSQKKIVHADKQKTKLTFGVRLQMVGEDAVSSSSSSKYNRQQDLYMRRLRLEVKAQLAENIFYVMDLRNDRTNQDDSGERQYRTGEAMIVIQRPFDNVGDLLNFKLMRSKLDVSRSAQSSSSRTIYFLRSYTTSYAQNFVSHNRLATNVQAFGDYKKKIHYSLAVGDGVNSDSIQDAKQNNSVSSIEKQDLLFGGKLIFSPFSDWEETGSKRETYFGEGKHFSLGYSHWKLNNLNYTTNAGISHIQNRALTNIELSLHYFGFALQTEYFEFEGEIEDLTANVLNEGKSKGYYVISEYFDKHTKLAPFFRYEFWDKFISENNYELESEVYGLNYYYEKNRIKMGAVFQRDTFGQGITGEKNSKNEYIRFITQFLF